MNNKTGNQNARKYPLEWVDTFISEFNKGKTLEQIAEDSGIHIRTLDIWKRKYITCIDSHIKKGLKNKFIKHFIETGGNYTETGKRIGLNRWTVKAMQVKYLPEINVRVLFSKLENIGMHSDNEIAFFLHITPEAVRDLRKQRNRIIKIVSNAIK